MNIEEDNKKSIQIKVLFTSGHFYVGDVYVKKGMLPSVALKKMVSESPFLTMITEGNPTLINAGLCESIKILSEV